MILGKRKATAHKMQIYSSSGSNKKLQYISKYHLGVMIPSCRNTSIPNNLKNFPLALDNGAYRAWLNKYPFDEHTFLDTLAKCLQKKLHLNFIVCPDLIGYGKKSLDFSLRWTERLICDNLALVLHHNIKEKDIKPYLNLFSHLFLGSPDNPYWKWKTAPKWVKFAHNHNKQIHIGACGTLDKLKYAQEIGADSVDSSTWIRNSNFSVLSDFTDNTHTQLNLW